jgi:transcriptional regulator with XRE-family HTH domain
MNNNGASSQRNTLQTLLKRNTALAKRATNRAGLAELASLLLRLRHELNLTQKDLATRAGVPVSTISELENTANEGITLRTMVKIARGAGASLSLTFNVDPSRAGTVVTALHTQIVRSAARKKQPVNKRASERR